MEHNAVVFKGTKEGLVAILDKDLDFTDLKYKFGVKSKALKDFLKGSKVNVFFKGRELSEEQTKELVDEFTKNAETEILLAADQDFVLQSANTNAVVSESPLDNTKFHRGTLRSGQSINYFGNVVIIGDINPGAQIVASGNVIVMGVVRGLIHAGAPDNNNAFVISLNLQPTQLRIGQIIARPPEDAPVKGIVPEIAVVKDDVIVIERVLLEK